MPAFGAADSQERGTDVQLQNAALLASPRRERMARNVVSLQDTTTWRGRTIGG